MSYLGDKMFKNAAAAGGVGFVLGAGVGYARAQSQINKLPTSTVEVPAYEKPIYDSFYAGTEEHADYGGYYEECYDTDGDGWDDECETYYDPPSYWSKSVFADYPRKYEDGSLVMQQVPATKVTDHGVGSVVEQNIPIKEPSSIDEVTYVGLNGYDTYVDIDYKQIGSYKKYLAHFETGVDVGKTVLTHAIGFAALGAAGAAIVTAAMNRE